MPCSHWKDTQSNSSNQFPNASTLFCVCGIMYWRLACGQREFHCWEALTWKGRGASRDWGHVSHFLCINIAPRRFLFYKIGICTHLQICSKWCHNLGKSDLSFVSIVSSLLNAIPSAYIGKNLKFSHKKGARIWYFCESAKFLINTLCATFA